MSGDSLSVVMIVRNEEGNLADCLKSLRFAGEVIVLDGGSADRTREIAAAQGACVYERAFDTFAEQRNHAASLASKDWILAVDADERVSDRLAEEILGAIAAPGSSVAAYRIPRRTRLFGRIFRFSGLQHDAPVRLYRRHQARFAGEVHETLDVSGVVKKLRQPLEHLSFQTAHAYWKRLQQYTSLEARRTGTCQVGFSRLFVRPCLRFAGIYIGQLGFLDGREGFVFALLSAYYEFVRWAKIWEQNHP